MDDLPRLHWSSGNKPPSKPSPAPSNAFANLSLKPSPLSSAGHQNGSAACKKFTNDSFSNLISFGRDKQTSNLSLLEQQKRLEEQRQKDEEARRKQMDSLFGCAGWDTLAGRGSGTPAATTHSAPSANDDDDLLAAFNSSAPVDSTSHYPAPGTSVTPQPQNGFDLLDEPSFASNTTPSPFHPDSFDLFGTPATLPSRGTPPFPPPPQAQTQSDDDNDDDILGELAKPLSELPPPQPIPSAKLELRRASPPPSSDPRDPVIAEIMDMGFTADQAKRALAETDTGLDVEAAVGWLLEEAHRKSRPTSATPPQNRGSQPRDERSRQPPGESNEMRRERERGDANTPAWARGGPRAGEKDIGAYAAEVGGTLFKSANSLWSTGRKKMERAVAELKADLADGGGDPTQPKWMRERQIREELEKRGATGISRNDRPPPVGEEDMRPRSRSEAPITDEALMLEMGGGPPPPRRKHREERLSQAPPRDSGMTEKERIQQQGMNEMEAAIREKEKEMHDRAMRERERARAAAAIPDSAIRQAKLAAESEPVYVSRSRRRPPPSSASSSKPSTPEPELLGCGSTGDSRGGSSLNPFARDMAAERQRSPQPSAAMRTPTPRRPTPKPRASVPISPSALAQSNAARQKGSEAFKRGDYTAAEASYTSALTPVPETHPLCIILLANRSLCKVKLGGPKEAIVDADVMLRLIGDSRGESETISLDGTEKDMKDYWLKAVTRKAECLEQLEKWGDAKDTWELALTACGNAAAINGKRRCEAALKPKAPPKPKAPIKPMVLPPSAKPNVAVAALRKANADQERQDNERLELHDIVHDRIGNWKDGKEGNLRALLAGLDTVLWEGSGWKKVGMGELLIPQKCKLAYMKGIAKVHPDKISQDATTEQKMISAAVFSLLSDSWEIFKTENGL